jgi:hypothetical protein
MKVYSLYFDLLANPFAIKIYRDLQEYYLDRGMIEEANAFSDLIQFRIKNYDTSDNTHFGPE